VRSFPRDRKQKQRMQSVPRRALVLGATGRWRVNGSESADQGWQFVEAPTLEAAEALFTSLSEIKVGIWTQTPEWSDEDELAKFAEFRARYPGVQWLAVLQNGAIENDAVAAHVAQHFIDYLTAPVDRDRLYFAAGHAEGMARLLERTANHPLAVEDQQMVGSSDVMRGLFHLIRKVAASDAPVFISGETGTGKELAARAIHERSARKNGPFVAVDCGAIPPTLIHSELFGYEKGAFTGATQRKIGHIEAAQGGTLFLDEIGDVPLALQTNLLRFLQQSTIQRVGATQSITVNTRVIAATHVKLEEAVAHGRFRQDLFYRLNVLRMEVPALRDRGSDVEVLARFFLEQFSKDRNPPLRGYTKAALDSIRRHTWPGNIRELLNRVRCATVMADGLWVTPKDLDLTTTPTSSAVEAFQLQAARETAERDAVRRAIAASRNNYSAAARVLGVSRPTFYRLLEKHRLTSQLNSQ
jgi:DNA-binding NtrC family response regulator